MNRRNSDQFYYSNYEFMIKPIAMTLSKLVRNKKLYLCVAISLKSQ